MMRKMYMFDYARLRSLHKGELSAILSLLGKLGYRELGFYIEGAFLPEGRSGAIREESITEADAKWILAEAKKNGLSVFPMTNVLYHMEHYLCQERYAHMRRAGKYQRYLINFEDPAAVPFALGIIRDLAKMFETKTVQIGLDEFPFTKEEIPAIGNYIKAVTESMLAEGLIPAVWGDMFWMEQSLTPYLPRETEIHDWNYFGRRPESLRYFREEGFCQVIAVPSDNGWEGFTGCQRAIGYLRARADLPVDPGEIEAFMQDAADEKSDGCMIANWSSSVGTSIWSALAPAARAALWLDGKWNPDKPEEEQVENALFGRITPYTRIVLRLRQLQMHMAERCHIRLPQDALYRLNSMLTLLNKPADFWCETIALYKEAIPEMEAALASWTPADTTERYARDAMLSVVTNVRAALALMEFSQTRVLYRRAAELQFTDKAAYRALLTEVRAAADAAADAMQLSKNVRAESIAETGITRIELGWQDQLTAHLRALSDNLTEKIAEENSIAALRTFTEFIQCWEFFQGGYVEI